MVNISEQLRNDRKDYVKLRERAALVVERYPDCGIGRVMIAQCRILDAAIANIDVALTMSGDA